jgi:hypothetical protein
MPGAFLDFGYLHAKGQLYLTWVPQQEADRQLCPDAALQEVMGSENIAQRKGHGFRSSFRAPVSNAPL